MGAHGELEGTLEDTVQAITAAGGRAAAVACNLLDRDARADLVARAGEPFGPIDVLVNNAAMASFKALPSGVTTKTRDALYDLNVNVPVELLQQSLPGMRERGAGWCLNITSRSAEQAAPPYPDERDAALVIGAYGATKAALNRYTEALAHELAPEQIFVNAVAPTAIVYTSMLDSFGDIMGRRPDMVEPVEMMAEAAVELCSGRHVGQVVYSRELLHATARPLRSLDGERVIGDAFTLARELA
jgi:NAD(P)-dependent dehydrogenase (short-subunit alcohol dehydrogenase family)